jgi:TP901 family phage tail tape measure protein
MFDVATLGVKVDSRQVKSAKSDVDGLSKSIDGAGRTTETATGTMVKGFRGAASMAASFAAQLGLVVGATAAIRGTVSVIASFEQSMAQVRAITNATDEQMAVLTATARELGATTEFSASQAADALKFLGMAGFTAEQSVAAIPDVLNLATAAALDLGTAADIASNVMSGFGIAADNASRVTDVLAAASSRANTDVSQLGSAIAYVGPVAAAMGIDIGDAAAAIGVLSDAGIQGSSAGTGLRRVLSSLASPTKQAADVLASLGVSVDEVNPATQELTEIINRLSGVGLSAADALTIFGDRGGPAILALVENNERVGELASQLSNVEGEAQRMAETMRDTLTGDAKSLGSAIQELALALNDETGLSNFLRTATQAMTSFVREINRALPLISKANRALDELDLFGRMTKWQPEILRRFGLVSDELDRVGESLVGVVDGAEIARFRFNRIVGSLETLESSTKKAATATKQLGEEQEVVSRASKKAAEETEKLARATSDYVQDMEWQLALTKMTGKEQAIVTALRKMDASATDEQRQKVIELAGALYEQNQATKEVQKATTALTAQADPMAAAFNRGLERMDDAFANFFYTILNEGKVTFDGLKQLFLKTLSEMIVAAARNRILVGIGMGGGASGAMASGGMFGGGVGGVLTSLEGAFAKMGFEAGAKYMYGAQTALADVGGMIGMGQGAGALMVGGAGLAGGIAANQLFNRSSNTGAAIGGLVGGSLGSAFGPLGTMAGSFLGSMAGSAIGGLFKSKDPRGGTFNLASGALGMPINGGDPEKNAATQAALSIAAAFQQMAGGSGSFNVQMGRGSAVEVNGRRFASLDAALDDIFSTLIDGATQLSPAMQTLLRAFQGSKEQTVEYAAALMSLSSMAGANSVTAVIDAFNTKQLDAVGLYRQQTSELNRLIDNYNGSYGATLQLNEALGAQKMMAAELAGVILSAQASIDGLIGSSIQSIRESIMTQDELRASREAERLSLRQQLSDLSDPREIERTVREVERLNRLIFESYSPEDQVRLAGEFIRVLEDTQRLADRQLEATLQSMTEDQNSINERIMQGLDSSAAAMQQASQSFAENVALFGQFVSQIGFRQGEVAF